MATAATATVTMTDTTPPTMAPVSTAPNAEKFITGFKLKLAHSGILIPLQRGSVLVHVPLAWQVRK